MRTASTLLSCVLALCLASTAWGDEATTTVRPSDTGAALVNPDMGWVMHFYDDLLNKYGSRLAASDTLDDFPGLSTVYLRLPWSVVEPREGEFDWSVVDTPAQRWISKGKKVALRITCSESWMRYATPEWVQKAGARGYDFTPGQGAHEGGVYWEPDYDDPIFLEKLDHFLAAMAQHYDGNPNVAFIDIGSYGVWGEGHLGSSTRKDYPDTVKQKHIDLYHKHFPRTLLALGDDFIGPQRVSRAPLTDHALKLGITLRDDSIMVRPPPRSWFHAKLAQPFWPRLPIVLETAHYDMSKQRNAWSGDLLMKAVEDYHASYLSIHWWPREFLAENRETIDRVNRRLGYRLQLREASWPSSIGRGQPWVVRTQWVNAGVAPCYPGGFVAITLKDAEGGIVAVQVDESFDVRQLPVDAPAKAPVHALTSTFAIAQCYRDGSRTYGRDFAPGKYDLFLSIGQRDGTPRIALPLGADDGQRRYRLGTVEVRP